MSTFTVYLKSSKLLQVHKRVHTVQWYTTKDDLVRFNGLAGNIDTNIGKIVVLSI